MLMARLKAFEYLRHDRNKQEILFWRDNDKKTPLAKFHFLSMA